ncbi:hypothetical protein DFH07DRAFT_768879 [Mycena maculata]|uniref:KOW domain-containing protein n=1 Tax=Mycena maculata TaxID=230809 RepID=A0AAD7JQE3_9AGAR|nr:hypothetical protein DFH07DRAFT_768879 [Mycena maculata]
MKFIDASEDDREQSESDDDDSLEVQIRAADKRDFTDAQVAQIQAENDALLVMRRRAALQALRRTQEECHEILRSSVRRMQLLHGDGEPEEEEEDRELWGAPNDDDAGLVPARKGREKVKRPAHPRFLPDSRGPTPYTAPGRSPTPRVGPVPPPSSAELSPPSSRGPTPSPGPLRSLTPPVNPQRVLPSAPLWPQEASLLVPSCRPFPEAEESEAASGCSSPPPTESSSRAKLARRSAKRRRVKHSGVANFLDTEAEHDEDKEDEDEEMGFDQEFIDDSEDINSCNRRPLIISSRGPSFADRDVDPHQVAAAYRQRARQQRARQQRHSENYSDVLAVTQDVSEHDPLPGLLRKLADKHEAMARNAHYPTHEDPWFYQVKLHGIDPHPNLFLINLMMEVGIPSLSCIISAIHHPSDPQHVYMETTSEAQLARVLLQRDAHIVRLMNQEERISLLENVPITKPAPRLGWARVTRKHQYFGDLAFIWMEDGDPLFTPQAFLVPRLAEPVKDKTRTVENRKLFDPRDFPDCEPLASEGARYRGCDYRYGLLVQDLPPSDVAFFDQKDVNPTHEELELWIASGFPGLNCPRPRTPLTMAIMEGDRVVRRVPRRTDVPLNPGEIVAQYDRLGNEQVPAPLPKHREYRQVQRARDPAERRAENEQDEADHDGWVVKTTTTVTSMGRIRWAIVKHCPGALQNEPSVVRISELGHHLLAPMRRVRRNDRVAVVDGEDALGKIGRVVEVMEATGTVVIASSFRNDAEELIEVRINNVHLQFFVGDVVEVTEGPHRGRVGFITHVSPGLADVFDPLLPPSAADDPHYQQQLAIVPAFLKFLDAEEARRLWSTAGTTEQVALEALAADKDGVAYDHAEADRISREIVNVGDPFSGKEVYIVGSRKHHLATGNLKGRFGIVKGWDPKPSKLAQLGDLQAKRSSAVEPIMLIDSLGTHWQSIKGNKTGIIAINSPPSPSPRPATPGAATPAWSQPESAATPAWQVGSATPIPVPRARLAVADEDTGEWLCLPGLVGRRFDVTVRGLTDFIGKKPFLVSPRVQRFEGSHGYVLMEAAVHRDTLNKIKVTVRGLNETGASLGVPPATVKPRRVLEDGTKLEHSTERVVIIGPDYYDTTRDVGLYGRVEPQEPAPPGAVTVLVDRPGLVALNTFYPNHLCLARNQRILLGNTVFDVTNF